MKSAPPLLFLCFVALLTASVAAQNGYTATLQTGGLSLEQTMAQTCLYRVESLPLQIFRFSD